MKVEQITITPDESMLFNIKQESKDENQIDQENSCQDMFDYNDDSESELIKSESKSESKNSGFSEETATFSCKHCNENFNQAKLLILHISENHIEDSNVKNLVKKQKNQKTPCGECGKLYSDSGLRAHMIRVSVLKTTQLLSPKVRNQFLIMGLKLKSLLWAALTTRALTTDFLPSNCADAHKQHNKKFD